MNLKTFKILLVVKYYRKFSYSIDIIQKHIYFKII